MLPRAAARRQAAFADLGTRDDLPARLADIAEDAELRLAIGTEVARRYLDGQGAFPDRLHVSGLAWRFCTTTSRWSGTGPTGPSPK